jgi:hypothetical protein
MGDNSQFAYIIMDLVSLPAKVKLHFKPGKEMRDRVNEARSKCRITN